MDYQVVINGQMFNVSVTAIGPVGTAQSAPQVVPVTPVAVLSSEEQVLCPMTGTIFDLPVSEGAAVLKGQAIAILEAMKMEIEIVAPREGVVKQLLCNKGDAVAANDIIAVIS